METIRYGEGDNLDNTVEENSSFLFLIQMCWLPSASACRQ